MKETKEKHMKKKLPAKRRRPRWFLSRHPVRIVLRLVETELVLTARAPRPRLRDPLCGMHTTVRFSESETQMFFRRLGAALGYELPAHRVRLKCPALRVPVITHSDKKLTITAWFFGDLDDAVSGQIMAKMSPEKADLIFMALADPLGWELYEKEVWV